MKKVLAIVIITAMLASCNIHAKKEIVRKSVLEIVCNNDIDFLGYLYLISNIKKNGVYSKWNPWEQTEKSLNENELSNIIKRYIENTNDISIVGIYNAGLLFSNSHDGKDNIEYLDSEYNNRLLKFISAIPISSYNKVQDAFWKTERMSSILVERKELLSYLEKNIELSKKIAFLENYFGFSFDKYRLIPSITFLPFCGTGSLIKEGDKTIACYTYGPWNIPEDTTSVFSYKELGFYFLNGIQNQAIHEYCHSFYSSYWRDGADEKISEIEYLYTDEVKNLTEKEGYGRDNWLGVFQEHIVRSMEILYIDEKGNNAEVTKRLNEENRKGFIYIDEVYKVVKKYRSIKDKKEMLNEIADIIANKT